MKEWILSYIQNRLWKFSDPQPQYCSQLPCVTSLTDFLCGNSKPTNLKLSLRRGTPSMSIRFLLPCVLGYVHYNMLTTYNYFLSTWLYGTTAIIALEGAKSSVSETYKYCGFFSHYWTISFVKSVPRLKQQKAPLATAEWHLVFHSYTCSDVLTQWAPCATVYLSPGNDTTNATFTKQVSHRQLLQKNSLSLLHGISTMPCSGSFSTD